MRLTNIILAIAVSASAADLRHYEGYNCGGGFAACVNVGAGVRALHALEALTSQMILLTF